MDIHQTEESSPTVSILFLRSCVRLLKLNYVNGEHVGVSQNCSVTRTRVSTEDIVMNNYQHIHTSAPVYMAIRATAAKPVRCCFACLLHILVTRPLSTGQISVIILHIGCCSVKKTILTVIQA